MNKFLTIYPTLYTATLSEKNFQSGFKATVLVSYNPDQVLSCLNTQIHTLSPPGTSHSSQASWAPGTSHSVRELKQQTKEIKRYLKHCIQISLSSFNQALNQLVKGCQVAGQTIRLDLAKDAAAVVTTMASTQLAKTPLPVYKTAFLETCLSADVLKFGDFTLKSGRKSPYFFNAGLFHTSSLLSAISTAFANTIISFLSSNPSIPKPDVIFGPAYKGIPFACSTLLELNRIDPDTWSSVSYSFNRKEVKDHGEGGNIVGAPLKGKNVLVIDDVITAGTAMRETLKLVDMEGGKVVGFVVALNRQEKMPGSKDGEDDGEPRMSAMGQVKQEFGVPTASIVTLQDLITLMEAQGKREDMEKLEDYRRRYRASD
ncbi:orotate phosphoribosyltransferase [Paracoccidioides brasiliensis]|nr:orotate phosphoribosyltransferase [Paracoccidioides brasiliensis]